MTFDVDVFMDTPADGPNTTIFPVLAEGDHIAEIEGFEGKEVTTRDGPRPLMEVNWKVEGHPGTVRQTVWLDLTTDSNGRTVIDTGPSANYSLGVLRAAIGQNVAGWTPRQMIGARAKIRVKHRAMKDRDTGDPLLDENGSVRVREQVSAVFKL